MTSPAIGAYLGRVYGDSLVVVLATAIALLDICFILVAVPESLPEKMRPASWGAPISWEQADPFAVSAVKAITVVYHGIAESPFISISDQWFFHILIKQRSIFPHPSMEV